MRGKFTVSLFILVAILVGFNAGYVLAQSPWAPFNAFSPLGWGQTSPDESNRPFIEAWNLIQTRYYDQPLDQELLLEGAINGMLATLDDQNTRYLPPTAESAAQDQMDGAYQGIGVVIEMIDDAIVVVSPIEGSPAEAAGLLPGDILRRANGVDLTGMDITEAANIVRGPAGTSVELVIERGEEAFTVVINRDRIRVPSVRGEMLDDGIAFVRINQFIRTTGDEIDDLLGELMAENPRGLILDLRRNPGGLLDQVVKVADQFLPAGTVLIEQFGDGDRRVYEATNRGLAETVPMVVLIDGGSASASEVLAGAIRDRDRGILIGQQSFGKGTIQSIHPLSNGGGLRLTIARWLTPADQWIDRAGLSPDLVVPLPEDGSDEGNLDPQLEAAIDFLLGRKLIEVEEEAPATP